MKSHAPSIPIRILHWLVGLLLIWASLSKIGDVQSFYGTLLGYQLPLPDLLLRLTAQTLPWVELFCGLMLLTGHRADAALLLSAMLFGMFTLATGQAWLRALDISCGCLNLRLFGMEEGSRVVQWLGTPAFAFWRAVVLLLLVLPLFRRALQNTVASSSAGDENPPAH